MSRQDQNRRRGLCEALEQRIFLSLVLPLKHSFPSAAAKLFLDFDGTPSFTFVNPTAYNAHGPGSSSAPIPAFTMDADVNNFSAAETSTILQIWADVAEKYSPFNIDVTTEDPGNRTHGVTEQVCIGGSSSDWYNGTSGGVAAIGGFYNSGLSNTCFAFSADLLTSPASWTTNPTFCTYFTAVTCAHEAGHSFGLVHERFGSNPTNEYYNGDASRSPIMGNASNVQNRRGIWWKTNMDGLQNSPDPIQDELASLASTGSAGLFPNFGYRTDDHAYNYPNITFLNPDSSGNLATGTGVIENSADVDPFEFQATGNNGSFTINSSPNAGMLVPRLNLVDAATMSNVNATTASTSTTATLVTGSLVPGHFYYIEARSAGNYGDVGQYTIGGTLQTFAYLSGSTLNVVGFGNANNEISITVNTGISGNDSLHYTLTDTALGATATQTFLASQVLLINVSLGSGDDTLNFGGGNVLLFSSLSSMANNSISMGAGNNSLIVDDNDYNSTTTYQIRAGAVGRAGNSITERAHFDSTVTNVTLKTGVGFASIVNIYDLDIPTTLRTQNKITINIGDNGSVQAINGALTINSPSNAALNIDDSADPTARNCLLSPTGLISLSPVGIHWNAGGINGLAISGGSGGNTFRVTGAPALFGGAQNVINGGSGSDLFIMEFASGTFVLNGQGGSDTLTVDDQDFDVAYAYAVDFQVVSRTGLSVGYSNVENVAVDAGGALDTFNITAIPSQSLAVHAGGGGDVVNFGTGSGASNSGPATTPIILDGGTGTNSLNVNDQLIPTGFGSNYSITSTSLTKTPQYVGGTAETFTYSNFASLNIHANADGHDFNVASTNPLTSYDFEHAGSGTNNLSLGSGNIGGIVSQMTFFPGGAAAAITINDQTSNSGRTYTFDGFTLNASGLFYVFLGSGLKNFTINGGNGNDALTVSGTNGTSDVVTLNTGGGADQTLITASALTGSATVNTGTGSDIVRVGANGGNLSALNSAVTVNGSAGNAQLIVNDLVNQTFQMVAGSVQEKSGLNVTHEVDYSGMSGVSLNCGAGAGSVRILSTAPGTAVTISPSVSMGITVGNPGVPPSNIVSRVTINGQGGAGSAANNLTIDDSGNNSTADIVHVGPTQVGGVAGDTLFGAGGFVSYAGCATLTVNTANAGAGDTIYARASASTAMSINAGLPTLAATGDSLLVAAAGATSPVLTPNGTGAGQYTFGNRMPITFTGIEHSAIDTIAPTITNPSFQYNVAPQSLVFPFSEALIGAPPLSAFSVALTSPTVPVVPAAVTFINNVATVQFAGILPDGNYHASVFASGVADTPGNPMAADFGFDFFVLAGDANRDRHVDVSDLGVLATNWQTSGKTFSQGDFNLDGHVDVSDLGILATNWQKSLPAASATADQTYMIPQSAPATKHRADDLLEATESILS